MARLHTGRDKVLSFYRSYHGNTCAAINSTGDPRRWPNEYATGHVHFFGPYLYRSEFAATTEQEECERALAHLRAVVRSEGGDRIAAIVLETVVGTNGILVPPDGYLAGVRAICDELGISAKVTPHDLRRTHGTKITALGFGREAMNRIQNHREGGIASVYDRHGYAEETKRVMEAVAAEIIRLAEGRAASGNVVPLRG